MDMYPSHTFNSSSTRHSLRDPVLLSLSICVLEYNITAAAACVANQGCCQEGSWQLIHLTMERIRKWKPEKSLLQRGCTTCCSFTNTILNPVHWGICCHHWCWHYWTIGKDYISSPTQNHSSQDGVLHFNGVHGMKTLVMFYYSSFYNFTLVHTEESVS